MQTDLSKGIIDGKTLKEWSDAPHGAFSKRCAELGITLDFGPRSETLTKYEVELRYTFRGYGYTTITVEAHDEKEAEKLALEVFENRDVDFDNGEVDDVEAENIEAVS